MKSRTAGDILSLLLRVAIGLIFIPHGYAKVFGAGGAAAFAHDMPQYHIPAFLGYVAAYSEFFGSILLIVGLLTRLDAFLLVCTMGVAILVVQLPDALNGAQPGANRYFEVMKSIELPLSLFVMSAAVMFVGPGRASLDALIGLEDRVGRLVSKKKAAAEAAAVM